MRKLFAMVATVAVVLSMFSGIAFAVNPVASVNLGKSWILDGVKGQSLTGTAKDSTGAVVSGATITLKEGATVVGTTTTAADGTFTLPVGTLQVETATAAGTVTTAGNATVVVTGTGITGSPKTISVPVTVGDDANAIATKIRAALAADTAISSKFTVSGTAAAIVLTARWARANDATLNISIADGTSVGVTTAAASGDTTAGATVTVAKANTYTVCEGATVLSTLTVYEPKIVVTSAKPIVSSGHEVGSYLLQGEVRADSNLLNVSGTVSVTVSGATIPNLTVTEGRFQYLIPTNLVYQQIVIDDVSLTDAQGESVAVGAANVGKLPVGYSVNLSTALDFVYTESPLFSLTGTLTDSTGKVIKGSDTVLWNAADVVLAYIGANDSVGTTIASTSTLTESGQFMLTVSSWPTGAGKIGVFIKKGGTEVLLKSGKVAASSDATVTATPSTGIVHSIQNTDVKLTVKGVPSGYTVTADLHYDGGSTATASNIAVFTYDATTGAYKATYTNNFATKKAGTYNIKIKATKSGVVAYEASTNIVVVDANAGYTLLDTTGALTKLSAVGTDNVVSFGVGQNIEAKKIDSTGAVVAPTTGFTYTVYVDGEKKLDNVATGNITLKGSKLGNIAVRVVVNDGANKAVEKTFSVEVPGWNVEQDVTSMVVNESKDITFKITDKDGNAINNAYIKLGDIVVVSAKDTSITNGTYVAKAVRSSVPTVKTVEVYDLNNNLKAKFSSGLTITGVKAYDVTSNFATLLLGKKDKVRLTISEGSTALIPTKFEMQQGTTTTTLSGTTVDTDSDGKLDAVDVNITPANTKDVTVRAMNSDGTKCGEVVMNVVSPTLVSDGTFLTNNIKSLLTFKVVDPRDNSVLAKNLTLTAKNFTQPRVYSEDKKTELAVGTPISLYGANEHKIAFYPQVTSAQFTAASDIEEKVELTVKIALDNTVDVKGTFEVKNPKIVSNPETITVGSSANLVLTYQDANEKPIVGKEIFVGIDKNGISLGKTDEKGQVNYAVTQSAAVAFAATTDDTATPVYTKLTVPATVDTAAPVVTAPETTDKATATINIKDNVRVIRLMVNGTELNIIPRAELNHVVNLKVGANKFDIVAVDNNYNVVEQTVTITYTPAANNSTVLQGGAVERKGDYVFVQIRQFEDLGATLTWNATAKKATFVAGGKTVEVTVGSTTAMVNGAAATMPAAPILVNGRVMVPTRFIAEALGWKVDWAAGDIVTITLP